MSQTENVVNPLRKKVIGRTMLVFLGVMLALTFLSNTLNNFSLPKVTCESPVSGAIVKQITGTGAVEAKKTLDLYAPTNMKVLEVKVKVGDMVTKGQLLLRLDTSDIENQLADERDNYEKQKINLLKLQDQSSEEGTASYDNAVEAAFENMQNAQRIYETDMALYEAGGESKSNCDNALKAWEDSKRDYENAVNSKNLAKADNQSEISSLQHDLSISERKISRLTQQLTYSDVSAPVDGVITGLGFEEGGTANSLQPLYKLADTSNGFQFVTTIDADSASYLARNDNAAVTITALGGGSVQGKIADIRDNPADPGVKKDLYIDIPSDGLIGGESGSADISKSLKTYGTMVSNSALGEDNGTWFVYVVKSRRGPLGNEFYVEKVNVTIGESDDIRTGITGGLQKGEQVVTASDKAISDNSRVMVNQ